MKKTNIFGLVLILSTLLIGCAQPNMCADIPEVYTITATETTNGTISLSKTTATAGETITVTATPASGYSLTSISAGENITLTGDGNEKTFTMPASNVTITATFTRLYTITVAETINGTISLNKTTAAAGEIITVTISLNEGYQLSIPNVTLNGTGNIRTFTMPSHNVTLEVSAITFSGNTLVELYIVDQDPIIPVIQVAYDTLGVDVHDIVTLENIISSGPIEYLTLKSKFFRIPSSFVLRGVFSEPDESGDYYKPTNIDGLIYTNNDNTLRIYLESVSSN